jgi:nucleotide-binding universal stress UspA family protein
VLHTWTLPVLTAELPSSAQGMAEATDVARRDAERVLADAMLAVLSSAADDVSLHPRLISGSAAGALLHAANERDLLILGRRGRDGFLGLLLGSVTEQCLHHARSPVVVVPPTAETGSARGRIVVGVDGSPASVAALSWALAEGRIRDLAVLAVHVWHQPVVHHAGVRSLTYPVPDLHLDAQAVLDRSFDALPAAGREGNGDGHPTPDGVAVERRLAYGAPASTLITAVDAADILVVGSRGRGGFRSLLLGSVSEECVQRAPCAVVVVRGSGSAATN